ncbi:MAG: Ig-like domain repeat protein [Candidatus Acidiferrales bacterium]
MSGIYYRFWKLTLPLLLLAGVPLLASAQTPFIPARITQAVDNARLTTLTGNTHPLARPEFDRGAAPPNLPMDRMLLVLQRSPSQEAALETLIDQQQDKSSPNYHKWVTPAGFGRQFGPSDQDIQTVVEWLGSQGFQGIHVSNGRTVIEFSGTASLVQQAFHTAIHKYEVSGMEHWANASDPQIPTALTPVVAGVATLHNFYKQPQIVISAQHAKIKKIPGSGPEVTFKGPPVVHALGPADYATIYNITPLYNANINGSGTTIAIVGRTDINLQDVTEFRNVFNLAGPAPQIILNGPDPGDLGGGEEGEAVLDTTWSGAVAPGANVDLVVSASTNSTDGVDLSEVYIVDNNLGDVMSESFGTCEQGATQADETTIASLAEQAAAQGITYMVATGDSGAEGCDNPNAETTAKGPVSVNILASSPFTVAVGGTEFAEGSKTASYWSAATNGIAETALSYIPENVWNESCLTGCGQNGSGAIWAGGGGASILAKKPIWQASVAGIPADKARDLPDVSLTAAVHDAYLMCIENSCQNNEIVLVGGTSAASPSFAGIMALVRQKTGERQGQADYVLYRLAAQETLANCNASSQSGLPKSTCMFNDVTLGNNAVPGELNYGKVSAQYQATTGYDLATGLGSVNAANLVNNWTTARSVASTVKLNVTPATGITHGNPVNFTIGVTPTPPATGTPTGDVSLIAGLGASPSSQTSEGDFTLASGGSVSSSTNQLPGGTYNLTAHYEGDGIFVPGDSSPASITIAPEKSTTTLVVLNGSPTGSPFTSGAYGTQLYLSSTVGGQSGVGSPTGNVSYTDNLGTAVPATPVTGNGTAVSSSFSGFTVGSHSVAAVYSGDPSFQTSTSSAATFTISQASTTTVILPPNGTVILGNANPFQVQIRGTGNGASPTGTYTLFSGSTQIASGPLNQYGPAFAIGYADTSQFPVGQSTVTAKYSGDINYTASTAAPFTINVVRNSSTSIATSNPQVQQGTNITFTATVTTTQTGGPAMTGTVQFAINGNNLGSPVGLVNGQAQMSTSSLPVGNPFINANYSGDSNYAPSSGFVPESILPPPGFAVSANPPVVTVTSPGASATTTLTFTAQGGFSGTINLSPSECTGLPNEATCSFSTASVTLNSSANPPVTSATATLTIQTTAPSAVAPGVFSNPAVPPMGRWTAAFALILFMWMAYQVSRRRWTAALTTLAFAALLAFAACGGGGGGGGTPPPTNPGSAPGSYPNVMVNFGGPSQPLNLPVTIDR